MLWIGWGELVIGPMCRVLNLWRGKNAEDRIEPVHLQIDFRQAAALLEVIETKMCRRRLLESVHDPADILAPFRRS